MLTITVQKLAGSTVLRCSGRMVCGNEAESFLRAVMAENTHHIFVDLKRVSAIDAAGLGALAKLERSAREDNRRLHLVNPSKEVCKALDMTNLISIFRILDTAAQQPEDLVT